MFYCHDCPKHSEFVESADNFSTNKLVREFTINKHVFFFHTINIYNQIIQCSVNKYNKRDRAKFLLSNGFLQYPNELSAPTDRKNNAVND